MPNTWRALRRRILTPNVAETTLDKRGFQEKDPAARELLERIGQTFLRGYAIAAEARSPDAAAERLEEIPAEFRGFAYEGAAMSLSILDMVPVGGSGRFAAFLAGRGDDHVYMAYVGVGWAMARLPRFLWAKIPVPSPLLRWLVLDGYGFHQAYFHTGRYVHERRQDTRFPWPAGGPEQYASRAVDQGIGRAMWFVGGADAELVATMIEKFPERRRPDLYSGAGLAATYAGGAGQEELQMFLERAGAHRPQVCQGAAFAAEARVRAGLVTAHTQVATQVLCGMTPARAAQLTVDVCPGEQVEGATPAYEVWRQRIGAEVESRAHR